MTTPQLPQPLDIENAFLDFLTANGIQPAGSLTILIDKGIQRYTLHDEHAGDKSGSYAVYTDSGWPIGWARDWHNGVTLNWVYGGKKLSKEQDDYIHSDEFRKKAEAAKKAFEQKIIEAQNKAADEARSRIHDLPEAPEDHKYLQNKHINPYGVKLECGNLVIPMRNIKGDIRSFQRIAPDGEKRFLPGGGIKGCFWSVGLDTVKPTDEATILLGEGYATMAKVYELTGKPSVAGISCGNLLSVAQALKSKYPKAKIVCMADNDSKTQLSKGNNPGLDAANSLVKNNLAVDVVYPVFTDNNGTDWDDYAILYGDDVTASVLMDKITKAVAPPEVKVLFEKITSINAQELRYKVFPPVKWAVEGFLPEGLSILAGGPKIGKSILALHLAVGVAIGGCVLGKINVQQGQVLYLALEDTQRRLQDRINAGTLADDDLTDLSMLDIVTSIPRQDVGGTAFLRYWLETHDNARLVIIDTLQMFRKLLTGRGSMYSEDYETVSNLKKIADFYHVAILILHHLKKGMEGDWLSEISGSQGISGAADTIFSLKRDRNSCMGTLHRTGRDVEEKDFIMKLDGYGWTLQGEAEDFTMPEWKSQIMAFLKDNPSITPMQLSDAYGLNINTARQNLLRLTKEGTIKKTGYGTYGLRGE